MFYIRSRIGSSNNYVKFKKKLLYKSNSRTISGEMEYMKENYMQDKLLKVYMHIITKVFNSEVFNRESN